MVKGQFYSAKSFAIGSLCLALIVLLLHLVDNFRNQSINRKLQSIPVEEKFFLEAFFRTLISVDNGSYVLFGDKPASLMTYEEKPIS